MLRKAFFLSLLISARAAGQCLIPSYVIPDTACPGVIIPIDNSNSSAALSEWDFCPGDLNLIPLGANQGMQGGVNYPQQLKIIQDGGNYYGFNVNLGSTFLSRYLFGNSLNNTPVISSFLNDPQMAGLTGIDMVKQGSKYYAFVCSFTTHKILRLEFDSLTQDTPIITDLGLANLTNPRQLKVFDHMLFVANWQTGDIVRYNFNGDYQNTPTQVLPSIGPFINAFGCDIAWDCNSSTYTGFCSSYGNNTLYRMDFGNSLLNNPTITTIDNTINLPQALQILKDNNEWYVSIVTNNNPGKFILYRFGNSLLNSATKILDETFGGILTEPIGLQLLKQDGEWIGYAPNNLTWLLTKINFPQAACNAVNSFSNATSPVNFEFNSGTTGWQYFSLHETDSSGNLSEHFDSIYVYIPPPKALFNYGPACEGNVVNFTDSSIVCSASITDWNWDFGDGSTADIQNPQHLYSGVGTYTVTLMVVSSSGDSGTVSQSINVLANPTADFTGNANVCQGSLANLIDNSTSGGDPIQSYQWDFGDGTSDAGMSVNHIYNASGSYPITLIVSSQSGCTDTTSKNIQVLSKPSAAFQVSNTCIGEVVEFVNTSAITGDTIIQYLWDFGDGTTSNTSDPDHTYPGGSTTYQVWLYTTAANTCVDSVLSEIKISNKPTPLFSVSPSILCEGNSVSFTDLSTISIDTINSWYWDFGDLSFSTTQNPVHSYMNSGVYQVNLTVSSPTYCDSSVSLFVNVIEAPVADFTFINACEGTSIQFTNISSSSAGVPITIHNWNFGDSTSSTSIHPQHTYTNSGIYTITLEVTDSVGCISFISKQINIYKKPDAGFVTGKICSGNDVFFADTSKAYNTGIIYWSWNFGNNITSTLQNPVVQYNIAQNYNVNLIVSDGNGCSDTINRFITVHKTPSANFGYSQTCMGEYMQFTNTTYTTFPIPPTNWIWEFGDNSGYSILENPGHSYLAPADYNVTLIATDSMSGCTDTLIQVVTVDPNPVAYFISTTPCIGVPAVMLDSSFISAGAISQWSWNSTLAGNINTQNFSYTYNQSTYDTISLTINSAQGCSDTYTDIIHISENPIAAFSVSSDFGSPPLLVSFSNLSINADSYIWNFGNGVSSNSFNTMYTYADTGAFISSLVAINLNGCTDTAFHQIQVVIPQVDLWLQNIQHTSLNQELKFSAVVVNSGNIPLNGYIIKVEASDLSTFFELSNDSIAPGEQRIHLLHTYFPIEDGKLPAFYCLELAPIEPAIDINSSNNKLCKNIITDFDIIGATIENQNIHISLYLPNQDVVDLQLNDISGKILLKDNISLNKGLHNLTYSLHTTGKGIYLLSMFNSDQKKVKMILSAK